MSVFHTLVALSAYLYFSFRTNHGPLIKQLTFSDRLVFSQQTVPSLWTEKVGVRREVQQTPNIDYSIRLIPA